jgi:hypothetical protein
MTDIVGRGQADGEVVGHVVQPKPLGVDQGLGEVGGDLVARGAQGQAGGEIPVVRRAPGVREGAPEAGKVLSHGWSSRVPNM